MKLNRLFILVLFLVSGFVNLFGENEQALENPCRVEIENVSDSKEIFAQETMVEMVGRIMIYLALLAGIGYIILLYYRKGRLFSPRSKSGDKLNVCETHMLGNKQFLVVVEYEGEKILLGVGPGMINKLCNLKGKAPKLETVDNP